ncbi:MAG TPA: hypothetical protein EYQ50_02335 [Verrucomicrobiales bacterium]|nr:hypothetical protein [Verrucomicrobiales bacterium]
MSVSLKTMVVDEFVRRVRIMSDHPDSRFAFFLGAGCSVSSGIPMAKDLVSEVWLPRLKELSHPKETDVLGWATEVVPGFDSDFPELSYGKVMDQLFLQAEERQREIEALCDGRFPGFGYAVLASLIAMEHGRFNVALTTNFDDLLAMAFDLFTPVRPQVVHLESMAEYIRPGKSKPMIVKVHGDYRLAPLNTVQDTSLFERDVEKRVRGAIRDRGLFFIGYGGNDEKIVQMLDQLSDEALPLGVYWVNDQEPLGVIRPWLESRDAIWVQEGDFDQLMLLFHDQFDLPHPDRRRFEIAFEKYIGTYQSLAQRVRRKPVTDSDSTALQSAADRADMAFPDWWSIELEAEKEKFRNPSQADQIYRDGLEKFPNAVPLMARYANFLRDSTKDYNKAEDMYRKAFQLDEHSVPLLMDYAVFLSRVRKDYDQAEKLYKNAFDLEPDNARNLATVAGFFAKIRNDSRRAEEHYRRAVSLDAMDPYIRVNFAGFLIAGNRQEEGLDLLNRVLQDCDTDGQPLLALEAWFYALAHGEELGRTQALVHLKKHLKAGIRRPGLILMPSLKKARSDRHDDVAWLEKLAGIINDEGTLSLLDDWPAWKSV